MKKKFVEEKRLNLNENQLTRIIKNALDEDIGYGDITTNSIIDDRAKAGAVWIAKEDGIISGLDIARRAFLMLDPDLVWNPQFEDGQTVQQGETIVIFKGLCRAVLTSERVALNFTQRMSGIATKTKEMVKQLEGLSAGLLDTRKTVPGLRMLDKYAVSCGGGTNHRMGLYDMAMIKDNHIVAAGGIMNAVKRVREKNPNIKIEVEAATFEQIDEALRADVDMIMLDNMNTDTMKQAVSRIKGKTQTEASGNITIKNVREVAETGVDYISTGALTHSVKAFDISQQIREII